MTVTVDLLSVLYAVLALAGTVLIIYLIIAIARLATTLSKVNQLLDTVRDPVSATAKQLPDLVGKIDKISGHVATVTDAAQATIPPVLNDVKTVTNNVRESVTSVGDTVHDVSDGIHGFFSGAQGTAGHIGSVMSILSTALEVFSHFFPSKPKPRRRRK